MKARDLKVGDKIKDRGMILEVTRIEKVTEKTITYRLKRIYPDEYDGNFFHRQNTDTQVNVINR